MQPLKEISDIPFHREAYMRGRLPFQAERAIMLKKVRHFLAEHPEGSTHTQVTTVLGENGGRGLTELQRRKLARFKRTVEGEPVRWFAVPMEDIK